MKICPKPHGGVMEIVFKKDNRADMEGRLRSRPVFNQLESRKSFSLFRQVSTEQHDGLSVH